jgi:hypothetical protein
VEFVNHSNNTTSSPNMNSRANSTRITAIAPHILPRSAGAQLLSPACGGSAANNGRLGRRRRRYPRRPATDEGAASTSSPSASRRRTCATGTSGTYAPTACAAGQAGAS